MQYATDHKLHNRVKNFLIWKLGNFAFWALRIYVKRRLHQHWWDTVDTWEVLTDFAEELSGCKCLETQWSDGKITRTLPRP